MHHGSARTTTRGLLVVIAIFIFARIYYIINENKKLRKDLILLSHDHHASRRMDNVEVEEIPFLFGMFLLVLAGMPILR